MMNVGDRVYVTDVSKLWSSVYTIKVGYIGTVIRSRFNDDISVLVMFDKNIDGIGVSHIEGSEGHCTFVDCADLELLEEE